MRERLFRCRKKKKEQRKVLLNRCKRNDRKKDYLDGERRWNKRMKNFIDAERRRKNERKKTYLDVERKNMKERLLRCRKKKE